MFSQIQDDREELRKHLVWLKDTVTFNVNKKTVRAGIGKVIEDGVDGWNRDSDARIVLKRGLDTSKGVDSLDRMNAICLGTPKLSDFSDLAATYVEHDDHDTVITDADIVLDLERIKRYCKLEMTVLHELGHLMGLQDVTSELIESVMYGECQPEKDYRAPRPYDYRLRRDKYPKKVKK